MPRFDDFSLLVQAARDHVDATGHEIIQADNPMGRQLGYACLDCGDDDATDFHCFLGAVQAIPDGSPLREQVRTSAGRDALALSINTNARNPMGFSARWDHDQEEPAPEAIRAELAHIGQIWERPEEVETQRVVTDTVREEFRKLDEARRPTRFERVEDED